MWAVNDAMGAWLLRRGAHMHTPFAESDSDELRRTGRRSNWCTTAAVWLLRGGLSELQMMRCFVERGGDLPQTISMKYADTACPFTSGTAHRRSRGAGCHTGQPPGGALSQEAPGCIMEEAPRLQGVAPVAQERMGLRLVALQRALERLVFCLGVMQVAEALGILVDRRSEQTLCSPLLALPDQVIACVLQTSVDGSACG